MMTRAVRTAMAIALGTLVVTPSTRGAERSFRVVTVAGHAEVQVTGATRWSAATVRTDLESGNAARTQVGRMTLLTPNGQAVRLAGATRIALPEPEAPDQPTRVRLETGLVWVAVLAASPPGQRVQVETSAVTTTISGSGVGMELHRDGTALIRVYHGRAECTGTGPEGRWNRTLAQDQELLVSSAGTPAPIGKLKRDKVDATWVLWNEEQDAAGGYGARVTAK